MNRLVDSQSNWKRPKRWWRVARPSAGREVYGPRNQAYGRLSLHNKTMHIHLAHWHLSLISYSIYLFIFETLETSVPPQTMHTHSDFSISMWILQKQICSLPDWLILNAMYLTRILIWRPHAWGLRVRTLDTFRYTRVSWLSTCQKKKPELLLCYILSFSVLKKILF